MIWFLAILKTGASKAWDFASRYPFQALCVILAGCLIWQTVGKNNALDKLEAEKAAHKADIAEWELKSKAAQAATAKAEKDAKDSADDAQKVRDALAQNSSALDDYIASHRVQDRQCPGSVTAASKGDASAVHEGTAAVSVVAVPEADVRACDAAWVYAQASYEYGRSLVSKGLAVDGE